jgi:hypothetical protein
MPRGARRRLSEIDRRISTTILFPRNDFIHQVFPTSNKDTLEPCLFHVWVDSGMRRRHLPNLEARWLLIDEALAVLRKKNASTSDKLKI